MYLKSKPEIDKSEHKPNPIKHINRSWFRILNQVIISVNSYRKNMRSVFASRLDEYE